MTTFKLPGNNLTLRTYTEEWTDFAEYSALKEKRISFTNLFKSAKLIADEASMDGVDDEDDIFSMKAEEIAGEIRKRTICTNNRYPFQLASHDFEIAFNEATSDEYKKIYLFLLYCTRLKMNTDRVHGGIDGALLFEHLCAEVAKNYFGEKSQAEVMGTGNDEVTQFYDRLGQIAGKVKEFGRVKDTYDYARPQDDKLDVVVWKGFSDDNTSKLIAFGQCKTGTSWINHLSELQATVFCKTWFTSQPVIDPLRLFFCSQYFPIHSREQHVYKAGLLFDRYRIMDYLPDTIDEELMSKISQWCHAVEEKYVNH